MTACIYFYNLKSDIFDAWSLLPGQKKLSIPSTSRTPTARREPPSINLLAGPDTPPFCSPFQQIPSLHNSWRTGHTRRGTTSPVKKVSDLRKIATLKGKSISGFFTPEESQENLRYVPFKILEKLIYACVEPIWSDAPAGTGGLSALGVNPRSDHFAEYKTSRIGFWLRRRPELC